MGTRASSLSGYLLLCPAIGRKDIKRTAGRKKY